MKYIFSLLILFSIACNDGVSPSETSHEADHPKNETSNIETTDLQLNNGTKWKADEATRKNVSEIISVINDPGNKGEGNRDQLVSQLQSKIDNLISQCRMQGADHDALHVWLEKVIGDLSEIKKVETTSYEIAFDKLKSDIERFSTFFD